MVPAACLRKFGRETPLFRLFNKGSAAFADDAGVQRALAFLQTGDLPAELRWAAIKTWQAPELVKVADESPPARRRRSSVAEPHLDMTRSASVGSESDTLAPRNKWKYRAGAKVWATSYVDGKIYEAQVRSMSFMVVHVFCFGKSG